MALNFSTQRLNVTELSSDTTFDFIEALTTEIPQILTPPVVENLPPDFHGIEDYEEATKWLSIMRHESRIWVIQERVLNSFIGFLFGFIDQPSTVHIGYLLTESKWGQGLASELLAEFIHQANINENWTRLIGGVTTNNTNSAKLLMKLGFAKNQSDQPDVDFYIYQFNRNQG